MTGYVASGDNAKALELWKKYGRARAARAGVPPPALPRRAFNVHRGFPLLRRALSTYCKTNRSDHPLDKVVAVFDAGRGSGWPGRAPATRRRGGELRLGTQSGSRRGQPSMRGLGLRRSSGYRSSASCPPNMSRKRCGCARAKRTYASPSSRPKRFSRALPRSANPRWRAPREAHRGPGNGGRERYAKPRSARGLAHAEPRQSLLLDQLARRGQDRCAQVAMMVC